MKKSHKKNSKNTQVKENIEFRVIIFILICMLLSVFYVYFYNTIYASPLDDWAAQKKTIYNAHLLAAFLNQLIVLSLMESLSLIFRSKLAIVYFILADACFLFISLFLAAGFGVTGGTFTFHFGSFVFMALLNIATFIFIKNR